jgi:membrane associated rhomboid family serine protease
VVIPIHDENPTRVAPLVTLALIALNVGVFLLSPVVRSPLTHDPTGSAFCRQQAYYQRWGAVPAELTHAAQLPGTPGPAVGSAGCQLVPPGYRKNLVASMVTALFVHAGWLHLLGNMLFLWVFGNNVEERFGRTRFLLFYLLVGVLSGYGFALSRPESVEPLVGASGAISGVLGAYLVLFPRARVLTVVLVVPIWLRAWLVLSVWFLIQAVNASGTGVSGAADVGYLVHLIGFVLGVVYGGLLRRRRPRPVAG